MPNALLEDPVMQQAMTYTRESSDLMCLTLVRYPLKLRPRRIVLAVLKTKLYLQEARR